MLLHDSYQAYWATIVAVPDIVVFTKFDVHDDEAYRMKAFHWMTQ